MNQICKVCGEPAAGFHFGAFTCEGCKSFFGRSYNNLSSISECKNGGKCIIDKKNRTTCKACRLRKCYTVGMSKGGSRYGRRSNWFKIHCLLQEQQQQAVEAANKAGTVVSSPSGFGDLATAAAVAAQQHFHHHQQQQQQHSPHFVPHMSGLLSYPNYLPEMSPFLSAAAVASTRHPADSSAAAAAAAAALPFFNMMNGLPGPQTTYPLPPSHLFFPGYHPAAAAAAAQASADVAYRSDVFQHRQSIDSVTDSQRHSPANRSTHSHHSQTTHEERSLASARQSPLLCVSGDEDQLSPQQSSTSSVGSHEIHSAITLRAMQVVSSPKQGATPSSLPVELAVTPPKSQPCSPQGITRAQTASPLPHIALGASMQVLSPVSVCSTNAEIMPSVPNSRNRCTTGDHQDSPMDLSMKASQSSAHSFDASVGESDVCEEELRHAMVGTTTRRKFYQLSEQGSDASSDDTAEDMVKRQKLATESQGYNRFQNNPTSLRGIFVCV